MALNFLGCTKVVLRLNGSVGSHMVISHDFRVFFIMKKDDSLGKNKMGIELKIGVR